MGSLGLVGRVGWRSVGGLRRPLVGLEVLPATLIGVYRTTNAARVRAVVDALAAARWDVRLWGLDGVATDIAAETIGSGSGTRTELLNHLAGGTEGPVLICDDDVEFPDGVATFVAMAQHSKIDLVQPAVTWDSEFSYSITACRPWLLWRETTFVEIGPVVYVGERAREIVFPMDENYGMGWGLELGWHDAIVAGRIRGGVIDAAPVHHLGAVGDGYAKNHEIQALQTRLEARGLTSLRQIQSTRRRQWRADR